jgi:hypothetical protein
VTLERADTLLLKVDPETEHSYLGLEEQLACVRASMHVGHIANYTRRYRDCCPTPAVPLN